MKKLLTSFQMKSIDYEAITNKGISSLILMENAGQCLSAEILTITNENNNVLFLCGKGNNGGDGFVAARHLVLNNINTKVISVFSKESLAGDALINYNNLLNFNEIIHLEDISKEHLNDLINKHDIIIDSLLGTGLKGAVKAPLDDIIKIINNSNKLVIAADIPSGICADTGKILGTAIKAKKTVTFATSKVGMYLYPAYEYCGEIINREISIPKTLLYRNEHNINLVTESYITQIFPKRIQDSHKNLFGRCIVIAGSKFMPGAALLTAKPVLKTGCGYCTLITEETNIQSLYAFIPECVFKPLNYPNNNNNELIKSIKQHSSIVIGPGLTTSREVINFVENLLLIIENTKIPLILDADAINCLSFINKFKLPENSVITPHPKELANLLEVKIEDILENKIYFTRLASEKYKCTTVLKGTNTIICDKDLNIYINNTGNSALATAGTGDVLSGIIGGFAAQNSNFVDMVILSVYLHGKSGEIASLEKNEYSVTAGDVINCIDKSINSVLSRSNFT
ncbi:MAG: NAD(P)H-hydrate dehydratase [bacterium]